MIPRIAAVVILFNPEESVVFNMKTYIQGVETLYVFDNSPTSSKEVVQKIERLDKIRYITEHKNVGVGVALNSALKKQLKNSSILS